MLTHVPYLKSDCYPSDGSERFPNNRAADAAISRTSRLQMEAITDPLFNAWYDGEDQVKVENGDECDDVFGPKLPGRGGNSYYKGVRSLAWLAWPWGAGPAAASEGCPPRGRLKRLLGLHPAA